MNIVCVCFFLPPKCYHCFCVAWKLWSRTLEDVEKRLKGLVWSVTCGKDLSTEPGQVVGFHRSMVVVQIVGWDQPLKTKERDFNFYWKVSKLEKRWPRPAANYWNWERESETNSLTHQKMIRQCPVTGEIITTQDPIDVVLSPEFLRDVKRIFRLGASKWAQRSNKNMHVNLQLFVKLQCKNAYIYWGKKLKFKMMNKNHPHLLSFFTKMQLLFCP